jgi:isoquinoline 1-oxidoreductase beta subunit
MRRRTFLQLTGVSTAGLVLGFDAFGALAHAAAAEFQPSGFIRIAADGSTTLWVTKVEMGQGVNTALPMILAEELDADWKRVEIRYAKFDPARYGNMDTGGSYSVRGSWNPLRKAGAAAREMLVAAAAQRWRVAPGTCRTESGFVIHDGSKRRAGYGELAAAAALLPVPKEPRFKDAKDYRVVDRATPRFDIPAKTDGSARFSLDFRLPGMLFASIERCPTHGGKLAKFDGARALALPGVRHVVPLARGVAVVATDTWTAMKARRALDITWDHGPHAALDSAGIDEQFKADAAKAGATHKSTGDFAAALSRAEHKLEADYRVPYVAHAPMEPQNTTAHVSGERCRLWAPVQLPSWATGEIATAIGIPAKNIELEIPLVGGAFGRRLYHDYAIEAALVSKAIQAPVQLVWTREDDMRGGFYRPASLHRMSAGVSAGRLTAFRHRVVGPSISLQLVPEEVKNGVDDNISDGLTDWPYAVADYRAEHVQSDPGVPVLWWRSVWSSQNPFASEGFLDECAAAAGADPLAFRLALLEQQPRHAAVLKFVAEKAGWGRKLAAGRGMGLAMHSSFGSYVAMVAEVSADKGVPRVHRAVIAIDCGQVVNPDTVRAQLEGAVVFGLSAALHSKITIAHGATVESNFDGHPILRLPETPVIEAHIVTSHEKPGGVGEPGVPVVGPSVANALFAATGKRWRRMPFADGPA